MAVAFRPRNFLLCSIGLSLAMFMQLLDTTIANVSLPTIAGNLGATAQQSTWVVTSFTVSNAIALTLTGWLARRFGEVKLFIAATALFTLLSVLCGAANSIGMLIVCRALQGFAAGPLYPVSQALMISIYPADKRTQAVMTFSIVGVIAPILGPILGGWITDNYNWPWIFFINVPFGLFATWIVWGQMKHKPEQTQRVRMDYVGLITLSLGIGALQILLDKGNDEDWFDSRFIVVAAIIATISLTIFLIWDLTDKEPVVDLRIFRHRNFTVGAVSYMLFYGAFFGSTVLVPIWLQTQLHYTPLWAGLAMAPGGVLPLLVAPLFGRYAHRANLRVAASIGLAAMSVPYFLRSAFNLEVDFGTVAYLQLFQGIGLSLFFMTIMVIMLSDLRPDEISAGSALAMFLRSLAASFSVSLSNYLWNSREILHHSQLAEQFAQGGTRMAEAIAGLGHGDIQLALATLDSMVTDQAFQISFNEVFLLYAMVFIVLIGVIWLARPPFSGEQASAIGEGH